MNRIYITNIQIKNKKGYPIYMNSFYSYDLEDAITKGKNELFNYYNNHKPRFRKISFDDYMEKLEYCFFIDTISGNRIKFKSYFDLKEYYDQNILNISNNELYDFLLSLLEYMYSAYDYKGNLIESEGFFDDDIEKLAVYEVRFTEDGCSKGEYLFDI